jgi:hypothetical protein
VFAGLGCIVAILASHLLRIGEIPLVTKIAIVVICVAFQVLSGLGRTSWHEKIIRVAWMRIFLLTVAFVVSVLNWQPAKTAGR